MSFAFKIDKALKANLYKICRLCGIDRDETVPILGGENAANAEGELELHQKISELIGIMISKDDKMPQSACTLCVDKINDFYEFREMCYATNVQTRKLLGLRAGGLKKPVIAEVKTPVYVKEEPTFLKRMRKRKGDELAHSLDDSNDVKRETAPFVASNKKQRLAKQAEKALKPKEEIKDEPQEVAATATNTVTKFRQLCNICEQRFGSKAKLEAHQANTHIPNIPRYICTACDETIKKAVDIKNHQLWHKLSKTPYVCGLCAQSLTSSYAYSRHLREHCANVSSSLLVLDRECPQCRQTFVTNFLYNTHSCAVRTKKCAGCNRQLRNELEYQRHAANCSKMYLKYSTHIPAAAVAAESSIRIKNENDVEAAAAAEALARCAGLSLDMAPVVSLTRMSTPVLMAATRSASLPTEMDEQSEQQVDDAKANKKSGKKGVSKKELKRVDELLKSTLDALVSIKHEPEVHVETEHVANADGHATEAADNVETGEESDSGHVADDFHHGDDDDAADDIADANVGAVEAGVVLSEVAVKQEVSDEIHYGSLPITIKQEVMDTDDVICVEAGSTPATKMPVLKLKIKKEHGTLNSSLVDDVGVRSEKKKKKKKRKESEKIKDKTDKNQNSQESISTVNSSQVEATNSDVFMPPADAVCKIKQEPLDDNADATSAIDDGGDVSQVQGEATVMTSIPRMQFQIAHISSGVEFAAADDADELAAANEDEDMSAVTATAREEMLDVKPNREELDRMLKIASVSGGVEMAAEMEVTAAAATRVRTTKSSPTKAAHRATPARTSTGKALKSTGGVMRKSSGSSDAVGIVGDELGSVRIKAEPIDRGYEAVYSGQYGAEIESTPAQLNDFSMSEIDNEEAYLSAIDFGNVKIKQERDEVSEVEMCSRQLTVTAVPNGFAPFEARRRKSRISMEDSESDGSSCEDEEDSQSTEMDEEEQEEEEEVREYREMEMPPLLSTSAAEQPEEPDKPTENVDPSANSCEGAVDLAVQDFSMQCEQQSAVALPAITEAGYINASGHGAVVPQACSTLKIAVCEGAVDLAVQDFSMQCEQQSAVALPAITEAGYINASGHGAVVPQACSTLKIAVCEGAVDLAVQDFSMQCEQQSAVALPEITEAGYINASGHGAVVTQACSTLKIAAVAAGCTDFHETGSMRDGHASIADVDSAAEAETLCVQVHEEPEASLKAQPFFDSNASGTMDQDEPGGTSVSGDENYEHNQANAVEEQQNLLNHEVAAQVTRLEQDVQSEAAIELSARFDCVSFPDESGANHAPNDMLEPIASSMPHSTAATTNNDEETENLINESAAEAQRLQQQPQRPCTSSRAASAIAINHFLLDDSNINEIAENNNNANIERELQDDVAAAERVRSAELELERRSNDVT